jgi:hypothetical protein
MPSIVVKEIKCVDVLIEENKNNNFTYLVVST